MTVYSQFIIEKELFSEYLKVNLAGVAQVNDIKKLYRDIHNIAENQGINKVIIDSVRLELKFESIEILDIVKDVQFLFRDFKFARVVSEHGHKQMLIQQIAEHNDLTVQNFNNVEHALSWLLAIN